jgi:AraC-like DNA-binding protein
MRPRPPFVTRYVAVGVRCARLTELVGEPVMQYVTRWCLQVGHSWLEDEGATVTELANRLGYRSEGAVARAVKRVAA